jgi:HK97 family phage major capsid protein
MKPAEMRARAAELYRQAQEIYNRSKDAPGGMSDEDARRYDALLDEVEGLRRKADEDEAREARANALDAAIQSRQAGAGEAKLLPHNDPRNTRGQVHQYSLLKALRQNCEQREGRGKMDGLELEVHMELDRIRFQQSGRRAKGFLVPWDLPVDVELANHYRGHALPPAFEGGRSPETRALSTTTGAGASYTIVSTDLISILRSRLVVASMGATIMPDMQGLFAIPRQSGAATGQWVAEGTAPSGSNQTIDQVTFSPKTAAAYTDYTRRFLDQSAIAPEQFVREDLMAVIARTVELAAIQGGGANAPTGILGNSAITAAAVPIGATGGPPTWATFVALETAVAAANADVGALGYVTNAKVRGFTKVNAKIGSTYPIFLWDSGPRPLNDYPVGITNLVPSNLTKSTGTNLSAIIFGNWSDLIICLWSGLDVLVDPYTGSSSGTVRVVCMQDADANVRHPESFSVCIDANCP